MNNCKICGKQVRLGGHKIKVNRKHGIIHYIAHTDGSPMHHDEWSCIMMKPYPKAESDKPRAQMVARWDAMNA